MIKPPFVRSAYNYDREKVSDETGLVCPEPTLTKQEFKEECDVNYIAERYGLTGEIPQVLRLPEYGDFTGLFDFMTAQNAVVQARQQFMTLPAKTRARFDNDPQKLLTFMGDETNRPEAEFLGLITKGDNDGRTSKESPNAAPQEQTGNTRTEPAKGQAQKAEGTGQKAAGSS